MWVLMRLAVVLISTLLMAGCATGNRHESGALWNEWRAIDQLQEPEYPHSTPIILVHGWNGSQFTWPAPAALEKIKARLHRDIYFFTYSTGIALYRYPPIEVVEEQLERFLANFKQVDIVAHSMGGLVVRQYLLHHGPGPIRRVVFLSTPHFGTHAAKLLADLASVSPYGNLQANEMQPGSDFLWRLDASQGHELSGVQVLNVFVADKSFAKSDLVVATSSAYLPGEPNVSIVGDHHTPALDLTHLNFIEDFLQTGRVPPKAGEPNRRDVWIRILGKGKLLHLPESAVQLIDAKGAIIKSRLDVCCQDQTGMNDMGGSTIVIANVKPRDRLRIFLRKTGQQVDIDPAKIEVLGRPVSLHLVELPAQAGPVNPSFPLRQ